VVRTPAPPAILRSICLPALLVLLGSLACVDHNPPGTTLFVFDGTSPSSVKVWNDVNKVYDAFNTPGAAVPAPDRTVTSQNVMGTITLGWGGMVEDSTRNRLYLVSQGGTVYSIAKATTQNGDLSAIQDIISFTLGSAGDHFPSGAFGQAALDPGTDTLYVQETSLDGAQTRIWYVAGVSNQFNQFPTPVNTFTATGDQWGSGLAAQGGVVYSLFGAGNSITDNTGQAFTGPRLRMAQNLAFPFNTNVLIGSLTRLPGPTTWGSLAFDSQRSALYVYAQSTSPAAVLVFNQSQLSLNGLNQAPVRTLADASLGNLRIIAHPPDSDWLLGADSAAAPALTGAGTTNLRIWKNPSGGGAAVSGALPVTEIRAVALGGSN